MTFALLTTSTLHCSDLREALAVEIQDLHHFSTLHVKHVRTRSLHISIIFCETLMKLNNFLMQLGVSLRVQQIQQAWPDSTVALWSSWLVDRKNCLFWWDWSLDFTSSYSFLGWNLKAFVQLGWKVGSQVPHARWFQISACLPKEMLCKIVFHSLKFGWSFYWLVIATIKITFPWVCQKGPKRMAILSDWLSGN